jgi:hypothetical protein
MAERLQNNAFKSQRGKKKGFIKCTMSDTSGCEAMSREIDLDAFQWKPEEAAETSLGESTALEESPVEPSKDCAICHDSLPISTNFYRQKTTKDGYRAICKKCFGERYFRKRACSEIEADEEVVVAEELRPDSLYTMENPRISGEVKVGRSHNPEERAKQLSAGNNFRLDVKRVYVGKGYLEKTIHQRLKARKVEEVAGTEWFKVSTDQADTIIKAAILEDDLSRTA